MLNIKCVQKHAKATGTNKVQTQDKECKVSRGHKEEGSGEIQRESTYAIFFLLAAKVRFLRRRSGAERPTVSIS